MLEGKRIEIVTSEGFSALPADKYTAQLIDVNIKTQPKYQSSEEEDVLEYKFQVLDDNEVVGEDGNPSTTKGRFLWKRFTPFITSRSSLNKLVTAIYGRTLTQDEAKGFDPESIIEKQVDVMVEQNPSKKDPNIIYNNIISFSKTKVELEPLPIEKRESTVVEKKTSSVSATAPDAEANVFLEGLEADAPTPPAQGDLVAEAAELEAAALEAKAEAAAAALEAKAKAAALEAKAKAARARAEAVK